MFYNHAVSAIPCMILYFSKLGKTERDNVSFYFICVIAGVSRSNIVPQLHKTQPLLVHFK